MEITEKIKIAKTASLELLKLDSEERKKVLQDLAQEIKIYENEILSANKKDVENAIQNKIAKNLVNRLTLSAESIENMCEAIQVVANKNDVLYEIIEEIKRPSGITIKKQRFPLGLVAIIYESRPNVTIDAFVMTFKSGNAVILKGGKEIVNTNKVLVNLVQNVLKKHNIDLNVIQDFSGVSREDVGKMLVDKNIDCLIPRGGKGLIDFVVENAKIPIIITGASVVHAYVDESASLEQAIKVIKNAKLRNTAICNALDVVLINKSVAEEFLSKFIQSVKNDELELLCDKDSLEIINLIHGGLGNLKVVPASADDFEKEFLSARMAVKLVENLDEAISYIQKHSLGHSEVIFTQNQKHAEKFFREVDSACVYQNTSTQFSDGGEFGMGGEIGISTQKLHARGPFAYKELTTYKYVVISEGAIRK